MAEKPPLRAVGEGETAPPAKPKSVSAAVREGTTRDIFASMLARISRTVDDPKCPPVALAALSKRVEDLADTLIALDAKAEEEAEGGDVEDADFDAQAI